MPAALDHCVAAFLRAAPLPHHQVVDAEEPISVSFTLEGRREVMLHGRVTIFFDRQRIFVESTCNPVGLSRGTVADILRGAVAHRLCGSDTLQAAVAHGFAVVGAGA